MTIKTPFSLSGKIAVITGFGAPKDALSNGGAIARLFAKQGAVIEGPVSYTHLTLPTNSRV